MADTVVILKSSNHICFRTVNRIEPKLGGRHWGDLENLNCLICSFSIFKMATMVRLKWNLVGGIGETWIFRTAQFFPFWHLWWLLRPSWKSSNDISSQTLMRIESKLDWLHQSDIEIQICWKLFWSNIWDGPQGGHLENLQTSSAP